MNKSLLVTSGGMAVFAALAAWQYTQLQELRESNAALARKVALVPAAPLAPPPGGGQGRSAPARDAAATAGLTAAAAPANAAPEDAERAAREARFQEMRAMDRKQRHDARVLTLTTTLNLSPEQQTELRALLESASAERDALREAGDARRRSGVQETEEEARANRIAFANTELQQEEKVTAMLSDEQKAEYANYKTEQKRQSDENWANQRLRELQDRFSLTEEQKDAAFQYFANQEQQEGFDLAQVTATGEDPMERVRKMEADRLEALKSILTPEQYELHKTQQEQRAEMFQNAFQNGGGPGPRRAP